MSSQRRIPSVLEPYIKYTKDSLLLLTDTVGTSVSWLALRFLATALSRDNTAVVVASWMRPAEFWRQELSRACGIDLDNRTLAARFAYVDAITAFADEKESPKGAASPGQSHTKTLTSHELPAFMNAMDEAYIALGDRDIILLLDSPDVILGTTESDTAAVISALLKLRLRAHAAVVMVRADLFHSEVEPQIATPMQLRQQQLVLSLAHQANTVFSVRKLDTGLAKDVTGVLRITASMKDVVDDDHRPAKEFLYHVRDNRAAVVWERGSEQVGN